MRGYDYLEFLGNKAFFTNAELRFPLIEAALTPIGVIGESARRVLLQFRRVGLRRPADDRLRRATRPPTRRFSATSRIRCRRPARDRCSDPNAPYRGFRLVDSRASYGVGLETFALGFPIHFDWSWRTMFNKDWEDALFSYQAAFGREEPAAATGCASVKFSLWIGYDF